MKVKTITTKMKIWIIVALLCLIGIGFFLPKTAFSASAEEVSSQTVTVTLVDEYSEQTWITYATVGENFSFIVPSSSNYTFNGWKYGEELLTNSSGVGADVWSIPQDVTLTADCTPTMKMIQFDTGCDTLTVESITLPYKTRTELYSEEDMQRDGYIFAGWYDGVNGTGTRYATADGNMVRDWDKTNTPTTLYAKWDLEEYNIQYILDGGINSTENPISYNTECIDIVLNNATKTGYRFMGWFDPLGNRIFTIPTGSFGEIILTADWEYEYTLSFTANNLSTDYMTIDGQFETIKAIKGEEIVLPDVNFGGFILKCGSIYYQQGTNYTVTSSKNFELVEKNRSQLYDSTTKYYEIWTYNQLNSIVRSYSSNNYIMKTNITQPEDTNWEPISTFTGTFDGNNYWINDLTIQYGLTGSNTTVTRVNYGLFEENKGTIKNLGISQGAFGLYKYTATYSNVPIYCGFIAAKNSGTISYCEVLGSFFQFAYIAPYIESISGSICGYNTGRVEYCEVFETGIQLTTGFGGGIVGHNKGGTITHCEIALSGVSCYQEFESDTADGYSSGHYGAVGGIVGYAEGGTISYCDVASNVDVDYNGFPSESRTLAPELGIIAGRSTNSTIYTSNVADGATGAINGLYVIEWETGWWIFATKHSWNQAQYVGGTVGRYV